jgi:hypothetical protein
VKRHTWFQVMVESDQRMTFACSECGVRMSVVRKGSWRRSEDAIKAKAHYPFEPPPTLVELHEYRRYFNRSLPIACRGPESFANDNGLHP